MFNHKRDFYTEAVIGEIFSKKEEFVLCICRFGEAFDSLPRNVVLWALRKLDEK